MDTNQNTGTLVVHFTKPGPIKNAEGLPVNMETSTVTIPKDAFVKINPRTLHIQHEGRGYYFGINSGARVLDENTQKVLW